MDSSTDNLDTTSRPNEHVVVIGKGHFGSSLAEHISRTAAATPYYTMSHTSRRCLDLPITTAVSDADILILAVPSSAYQSLIPDITPHLRQNAIVIDVANGPLKVFRRSTPISSTATLSKLLPPNVSVVKAFNTLSANLLTELNEKLVPLPTHITTPYAADRDETVMHRMYSFLAALGFTPYYMGSLPSAAKQMESIPHVFFPEYKSTFIVSTIVWAFWILYSLLSTYVIHGSRGTPSRPWDKFPLSSFMASTAETAITLFAITFLAGPFTIIYRKFTNKVPTWLKNWLNRRKQLGLSAFLFASAHGIAGAISASHLDDGWKGQFYFVPGIM
ncbi:metalloreductase STEAP3 [Gracilaria domingensis]|nr:metalloreductase STEAP3 [Gracilaria domingensis]